MCGYRIKKVRFYSSPLEKVSEKVRRGRSILIFIFQLLITGLGNIHPPVNWQMVSVKRRAMDWKPFMNKFLLILKSSFIM